MKEARISVSMLVVCHWSRQVPSSGALLISRIGKLIGSRDHSTVLHSIAIIEEAISNDKAFAREVKEIERGLDVKKRAK